MFGKIIPFFANVNLICYKLHSFLILNHFLLTIAILMNHNTKSIRPFIGANDFGISRSFYNDWGFEEVVLSHNLSLFKTGAFGFYLQDYAAKDWIDNTMIFLEVENVADYWKELTSLNLPEKYKTSKIVSIRTMDWGKECFVHDPSGILWQIGEFF